MSYCAVCGKELCAHSRVDYQRKEDGWYWKCCDCGETDKGITPSTYFVPMYEGKVVNPNTHEWAGFDACKECSEKSIQEGL